MHHNHGQSRNTFSLPVTPAPHFDPRRNLNKPFFRCRQTNPARQQKAGDGLHVPSAQPATRAKLRTPGPALGGLQSPTYRT